MKNKLSKILAMLLAAVMLCSLAAPAFAAENTDTLHIYSVEDLMELAKNCTMDTWSQGKIVSLETDISLEGIAYQPIPSFGGIFRGNGYTVSGLELTDSAYPSGLFGILQERAVVQDLHICGAVTPSGDQCKVGGIAGENRGTIQNCTFTGTVIGDTYTGGIAGHNTLTGTVKGCTVTGEVIGKNMTGGIVGHNEGVISQCSNKSLVNTISLDPTISLSELNDLLTADLGLIPTFDTVNIATDTGGIAGYSSGMILGSENDGTVGYFHIGYNVGGIVGRSCGHLANCQNHGAVYGRKEVGGIAGQMEPHISLNLSVDYIAQLQTELDVLHQMINSAANHADSESAVISSRLNTLGGLIGSASSSAKDLSNQVADLGKDIVTEINRGSDILDETISQLSGIADQFPALSEKITLGLDQLEDAVLAMAEASELGTAAIQDMKLAAEDAVSSISMSRTAANKISEGLDNLASALNVNDKDAAKDALNDIADGFSELTDAVSDMSDAVDAVITVLQNAGWTEDGVTHLRSLSTALQNIGTYLNDIHDAVTAIRDNIDVDWEKFTQGSSQLLEALGYFSTASQKFDEAMALAESGMGKISSGLEQMLGGLTAQDQTAVDTALAQISTGVSELSQAASDASNAMTELSNALYGMDGLGDLSGNLDEISTAIGSLAQAGQNASNALSKIAEGVTVLSENVKIDAGDAESGAALTLEGFDELSASIEKLREANTALNSGLTLLRHGLSNLSTAVEIKDEAAIRAALDDIHTALGNIAAAIKEIGVIMENMAETLEEVRLWGDSLGSAVGQMAAAFSAFSDALAKIQSGVDSLRANVSFDLDSASDGLLLIRDGMQTLVSASVALGNSIDHLYDSMEDMESASRELTNALQLLAGALDTFGAASEDMTDILRDTKALLNYLDGVDPIQLPSPGEDVSATADELYAYITDAEKQLGNLNQDITSASESLTEDIRAINDQFSKISATLVDAIYHTENAVAGDVIQDISEETITTITAGKALACTNDAYVEGDINVGGIAGAIAVENQLDPEDDLSSALSLYQYQSYELSAVVQSCVNEGAIVAKKDQVGGICGKMDLGLLIGCEAYGSVKSETGDYVGGIAGSSQAVIRSCFAKCTLSGGRYIGGIIGCGSDESSANGTSVVSGCYALVEILDCTQYAGAIAGFYTGTFEHNYFVSDLLTGINRLSYFGQAEPISYQELLKLGEISVGTAKLSIVFPKEFLQLTLRFVADGEVLKSIPIEYGDSFDESIYPALPAKDGYYAHWDRETLQDLHYDTVVTAVYTPDISAIASAEQRSNGRPIFFVEGQYDDASALMIQAMATTPAEFDVFPQSFRDAFVGCFTGSSLSRQVIEQWAVTLPQDGEEVHTLRYLAPDGDPSALQIYVKQDGSWKQVQAQSVGSYLCFAVAGETAEIAVISTMPTWWVRLIVAVLTLLILIVVIRLIHRLVRTIKRRRKAREERKVLVSANFTNPVSDGNGEEESSVTVAVAAPVKQKKKRKILPLLIILILLGAAAAAGYVYLLPELSENYEAYTLVQTLAEKETLSMELAVDAVVDETAVSMNAMIEKQTVNEHAVTGIQSGAVTLYYSDGAVFLENGNAYQVSNAHPDQSQVLTQVVALLRNVDVSAVEGTYAITAQAEQAEALLDMFIPSAAGEFGNAQMLSVELLSENNSISEIRFYGSGNLANPQNTAYTLSAALTVLPESAPSEIPQAVLDSIEQGASEDITVLTEDILRLATAWQELSGREQISTVVNLTADCGPLTVGDQLELHYINRDGLHIGVLQKDDLAVYFSEDTICDKYGHSVSTEQSAEVEAAKVFELVYELCMISDADCTQSGEGYLYSLRLDEEGMKAVATAIAPGTADMDIEFESGSVELLVENGKIQDITVSCAGTVKLLLSSADASISANIQIVDNAAKITIPQEVLNALSDSHDVSRTNAEGMGYL